MHALCVVPRVRHCCDTAVDLSLGIGMMALLRCFRLRRCRSGDPRHAMMGFDLVLDPCNCCQMQFQEDAWVRPNGGGGISRVIAGGKVFEKAGVNLSVVYGTMPQEVCMYDKFA